MTGGSSKKPRPTLGYLGPEGTYTEEAAATAVQNASYVPYPSIDAVFDAVAQGAVDRGLVPIENVIEGPVTETLDNLYDHAPRVKIVDMLVLPIEHALGALEASATVIRVLSKDQALKQCSRYLGQCVPTPEQVETSSTAAAMRAVLDEGRADWAAIGSPEALQRLGLCILARNIGNVPHNKTRFAVLGSADEDDHPPTGRDATALVIYPHHDRIGLLHDILTVISHQHDLSCSEIHSRPDRRGAFRFYLELEGHVLDPKLTACLDSLTKVLEGAEVEVKIFGAYPRRAFVEPRLRTVGLIGGTGRMGQWFESFFQEAGYEVLVAGRKTPLTYEQCVERSDAVIVSVPIRNTVSVIQRIAPHCRPGQLLVDNTSIKTQPVAAMLESAPEGVEVLGMHTVFGPSVQRLRAENVIFTRTPTSGELAHELESVFFKYGARVTYSTPEYHDRQMAFHQNLEHFTKVVLAEVLRSAFPCPQELGSYSSPNSRASLATMSRILSSDAQLCAEIQTHNLQGPEMIRSYLDAARRLGEGIIAADTEAFSTSMNESAQVLGEPLLTEMRSRMKG